MFITKPSRFAVQAQSVGLIGGRAWLVIQFVT